MLLIVININFPLKYLGEPHQLGVGREPCDNSEHLFLGAGERVAASGEDWRQTLKKSICGEGLKEIGVAGQAVYQKEHI